MIYSEWNSAKIVRASDTTANSPDDYDEAEDRKTSQKFILTQQRRSANDDDDDVSLM